VALLFTYVAMVTWANTLLLIYTCCKLPCLLLAADTPNASSFAGLPLLLQVLLMPTIPKLAGLLLLLRGYAFVATISSAAPLMLPSSDNIPMAVLLLLLLRTCTPRSPSGPTRSPSVTVITRTLRSGQFLRILHGHASQHSSCQVRPTQQQTARGKTHRLLCTPLLPPLPQHTYQCCLMHNA
jgi:hypothetical protein